MVCAQAMLYHLLSESVFVPVYVAITTPELITVCVAVLDKTSMLFVRVFI